MQKLVMEEGFDDKLVDGKTFRNEEESENIIRKCKIKFGKGKKYSKLKNMYRKMAEKEETKK